MAIALAVLAAACVPVGARSGAIPLWAPEPPDRSALAYGSHPSQVLDVYLPASSERRGTIVYVHGGAFVGGWRQQIAMTNPEILGLTSLGWSVVTVDYRVDRSIGRIGGQVEDVRRALQWVRHFGPGYGLDTSTVVTVGQSSGASLVMLGASSGASAWPADAWVAIAGVADIPEWTATTGFTVPTDESLAAMSPVNTIGETDTPGYVMHATEDGVVPVSQSRDLVELARQEGVAVTYDEIALTPGCDAHSATCGMDDAALLGWLVSVAEAVQGAGA